MIKAFRLYNDQMTASAIEPLLSVTRAWRLVKFVDNGMLTLTKCSCCGGNFVTEPYENRAFRLRPVRATGACRQGRGLGRHSACTDHAPSPKT